MILASSLLPYKIGAALIVIGGLVGMGYYSGHSSRDDEVFDLNNKITTCETLTAAQNAAVTQLKAAGDEQGVKIMTAQVKAAAMASRLSKAVRPQVADADALKWGEERARELSEGWSE